MIEVENDHEPVNNEQQFIHTSTKIKFLQDYYNRPTSNNLPIVQEVNEVNTLIKPEKDQVPCSSTNQNNRNKQKESPK